MNRLHHLKRTLQKNIDDNTSYPNLEIVVLNYNSDPDMDEWINSNCSTYIASGKLVYAKYNAKYFDPSHAKNMAAAHASGDLICNVDADNFTGRGFAEYLNHNFCKRANIFMMPEHTRNKPDTYGRICVWREDFFRLNGYDERMNGYGWEDVDIHYRLVQMGKQRITINKKYLRVIEHSDYERISFVEDSQRIDEVYLHYISPTLSGILFLQTNMCFESGFIIPDKTRRHMDFPALQHPGLIKGDWSEQPGKIVLSYPDGSIVVCERSTDDRGGPCLVSGKTVYHRITDSDFRTRVLIVKSSIFNLNRLRQNLYRRPPLNQ